MYFYKILLLILLINFFYRKEYKLWKPDFSHHGLWDTHMHSQFSGDSEAPQEEMIATAIEKDLPESVLQIISISTILRSRIFFFSTCQIIFRPCSPIQEKYAAKLPVRLGIELGLQPHLGCAVHGYFIAVPI